MAITWGNFTAAGDVGSTTTYSFAHTCAANTDILVVMTYSTDSAANDSNVTGVTYNGEALTKVATQGYTPSVGLGFSYVQCWYMPSPPTGTSYNIAVTHGGKCSETTARAWDLIGVNKGNPLVGADNTVSVHTGGYSGLHYDGSSGDVGTHAMGNDDAYTFFQHSSTNPDDAQDDPNLDIGTTRTTAGLAIGPYSGADPEGVVEVVYTQQTTYFDVGLLVVWRAAVGVTATPSTVSLQYKVLENAFVTPSTVSMGYDVLLPADILADDRTLVASYTTTAGATGVTVGGTSGNYGAGQSFLPDQTGMLDSVKLYMDRNVYPIDQTFYLRIWNNANTFGAPDDVPTGAPLVERAFTMHEIPKGPEWVTFHFDHTVELDSGSTNGYVIGIWCDDQLSGRYINLKIQTSGDNPGNFCAYTSSWAGSSWDGLYQVFAIVSSGGATATPSTIAETWVVNSVAVVAIQNVTVSPDAISETWAVGTAVATAGVVVSPDTVTETWVVNEAAVLVGATTSPDAVAETWTINAPTIIAIEIVGVTVTVSSPQRLRLRQMIQASFEEEQAVASYIHGFIAASGMLYAATRTTPGRLIRFNNPYDLTDYDEYIFPNDGQHVAAESVVYANDHLYVVFGNNGTTRTLIAEVNLSGTLAHTDVINDTTYPAGSSPGFATDGSYLYVSTQRTPAYVNKYSLSTFNRDASEVLTGYNNSHAMVYDGTSLFAIGTGSPGWVAKIDPSDLSYSIQSLSAGETLPTDDLAVDDDNLYIGLENPLGYNLRVSKADISVQAQMPIVQSFSTYCVYKNGGLWTTEVNYNPGYVWKMVSDGGAGAFALPIGRYLPNELYVEGNHLWVTCFLSPAYVMRYELVPLVITGANFQTGAVSLEWTVGTPTISLISGATATPSTVAETWTVQDPVIETSALVEPSTVAEAWSIGIPTVTGASLASVAAVGATWAVGVTSVVTTAILAPAALSETWTVQAATVLAEGAPTIVVIAQHVDNLNHGMSGWMEADGTGIGNTVWLGPGALNEVSLYVASGYDLSSGQAVVKLYKGTPYYGFHGTLEYVAEQTLPATSQNNWAQVDFGGEPLDGGYYTLLVFINDTYGRIYWGRSSTAAVEGFSSVWYNNPNLDDGYWQQLSYPLSMTIDADGSPLHEEWTVKWAWGNTTVATMPGGSLYEYWTPYDPVVNTDNCTVSQNGLDPLIWTQLTWAVGTPVFPFGITVEPAALSELWTVGAATVATGTKATPSAVSESWTVNTPTVETGAVVTVAAVAEEWTVRTPSLGGGLVVEAQAVGLVWTVGAVTVEAGALFSVATVAEAWSIGTPTFVTGAVIITQTVAEAWTVNAPTLITAGSVTVLAPGGLYLVNELANAANGSSIEGHGVGEWFENPNYPAPFKVTGFGLKLGSNGFSAGDVELWVLTGSTSDTDEQTLQTTIPVNEDHAAYDWVEVHGIDYVVTDQYFTLAFINAKTVGGSGIFWSFYNVSDVVPNAGYCPRYNPAGPDEWGYFTIDATFRLYTHSPIVSEYTVLAPTVGSNVTATPATLEETYSIQAATATGGATATPSTLAETWTVNEPTVTGHAVVEPAAVPLAWSVGAPTVIGYATVTVGKLTTAYSVNTPSAYSEITVPTGVVEMAFSVGVPSFTTGVKLYPSTMPAMWAIRAPTILARIYGWTKDEAESGIWTRDGAESGSWTKDEADTGTWVEDPPEVT